jgi:hypothetical protein
MKEWEGIDWSHLADVRHCWQVLINTVMSLSFMKGKKFLD